MWDVRGGGCMAQYICSICGYIHDEEKNGSWESLSEDWKCPLCSAGKEVFRIYEEKPQEVKTISKPEIEKELSPMEMSIICSNLARGCEKQYMQEQSEDFKKLAEFFRNKEERIEYPETEKLLSLIEKDLAEGYPYGNLIASEEQDRGALRALVWSEKVTRMLQSLLSRYQIEGEKMLENTGVYVCTVCGFVYIGKEPPKLCPVCKVPDWKFEKVEGRQKG